MLAGQVGQLGPANRSGPLLSLAGEVSVLRFEDEAIANNLIAVTGPMPSAEEMKSLVPAGLQQICLKRPWSDGMLLLALREEEKKGWPVLKQ